MRRLAFLLVAFLATGNALARGTVPSWPDRTPAATEATTSNGVIRTLEGAGYGGVRIASRMRPLNTDDKADLAALFGERPPPAQLEGAGGFIFLPNRHPPSGIAPQPAQYFKFISARPALVGAPDANADRPPLVERTWFALYDASTDVPVRGTALVMPGLFNTPEPVIERLITALHDRGWVVLRMLAQPSRFTQKITFDVDTRELDPAAQRIASETDQRVAECAYAVQAAFAHVIRQRPALATLPRIALGMSGGAMTMPTVVAREPQKYAALVMIGGGADYFAINDQSNYQLLIDAVQYRWTPSDPTPEQRAELDRLYLSHASLDSYHTADLVRDTPMLLIQGKFDAAVPSSLGDLLWERLGKPDRWLQDAGHEELFMKLPSQIPQLMAWIDNAVPGAVAAPAGAK